MTGPSIVGAEGMIQYLKMASPYNGSIGYLPLMGQAQGGARPIFERLCTSEAETWECTSNNPLGIGIRAEPSESAERSQGPAPGERVVCFPSPTIGENDFVYLVLRDRFHGQLGYVPLFGAATLKTTYGDKSSKFDHPGQVMFARVT